MTSRRTILWLASTLLLGCSSDATVDDQGGGGGAVGTGTGGTAPVGLVCPASEQELIDNDRCVFDSVDTMSPRCSYPGSGCPHVYECVRIVNSPAPNDGWYGLWTAQPPVAGDACDQSGTVCSYSFGHCYEGCLSGSTHYTCTDAHQWVLSLEAECRGCTCCADCPTTAPAAGAACDPYTFPNCTYHDSETECATEAACNEGIWTVQTTCP